jgi:uncharacterized protein involved in exopolysaccharide biosynthesis
MDQTNQEDEINLFDYWQILVKRKRLIFRIVASAFVIAIVVSLLLPKIYAATTSILPPQKDGMGALMGASLGQLPMDGMGLAGSLLGMQTPADLWVGILKSNSVMDAIIDRFGLKALYEKKTREETREVLKNNIKILKGKEGIISVTVEDKDPKRAAAMANAFVTELDKINKKNGMSSGRRTRMFVEKRLAEAKVELSRAEEVVKGFLEKNKAVKLDAQSEAIIGAIGEVKGALMAKEVELQTLLSFATPNHPQAEILHAEVDGLKERMRELSEGSGTVDNPASDDIFIPTAKMPNLGLQYVRLLRKVKIQETLHTLLTQQYEMARIQEAKDSPTVQILDIGKIPEKKVKPKRGLIVILSTFTAIFFSVFTAFFMESLEKSKLQARLL